MLCSVRRYRSGAPALRTNLCPRNTEVCEDANECGEEEARSDSRSVQGIRIVIDAEKNVRIQLNIQSFPHVMT